MSFFTAREIFCLGKDFKRIRSLAQRQVISVPDLPGDEIWLGCQDSNLGMRGSKPRALPLGDTPIFKYQRDHVGLWDYTIPNSKNEELN